MNEWNPQQKIKQYFFFEKKTTPSTNICDWIFSCLKKWRNYGWRMFSAYKDNVKIQCNFVFEWISQNIYRNVMNADATEWKNGQKNLSSNFLWQHSPVWNPIWKKKHSSDRILGGKVPNIIGLCIGRIFANIQSHRIDSKMTRKYVIIVCGRHFKFQLFGNYGAKSFAYVAYLIGPPN